MEKSYIAIVEASRSHECGRNEHRFKSHAGRIGDQENNKHQAQGQQVEFTEKTGANGEGSIAASMVPEESSEKVAFDTAFFDAYGQAPGSLSAFSWAAFDTGGYLMTAVKAVAFVENDTLYVPRGALVKAMREVEFPGLLGLIKCDATGECNDAGPTFFKVVDGVWAPLELSN